MEAQRANTATVTTASANMATDPRDTDIVIKSMIQYPKHFCQISTLKDVGKSPLSKASSFQLISLFA